MKFSGLLALITILILAGCKQSNKTSIGLQNQTEDIVTTKSSSDKEEFQNLIRTVLKWADSKNAIDLLPVIADSNDSIYVGFDFDMLNQNLKILKETNFFCAEFIDNYNQIITTLDKKLKNGEFVWQVGELPPFSFINDVSPWCSCQDNLQWDNVEVRISELNNSNGELIWKWGKLDSNSDPSWKEFEYRFRVSKEDNRWKISYMQGFDLIESTRKDGL